ncbi:type II TA system antitoxin MqsA family protein [Desulfovermiculus halophilus]|uniref:type II TA system antitoxin MqsA family protein n=1 Tax=Desulfovermiculus halophilus TaxID=339722 RepID=UPI0009FD873E|nr:type II TA system antitoxin MqsA family protein [Desulfovermiculus halophilus]
MNEMCCPKCASRMELKELHKRTTIKGVDVAYPCRAYVCPGCGLEAGTVRTAGDAQRAAADAYRAKAGLLTGREIKSLREAQGVSQRELAEDLQVGIASIKRWETGAVQSESKDKLLRLRLLGDESSTCTGDRESGLHDLLDKLIKFRDERDWAQFQTPKNLAVSVSLEAAELLEHFQWSTEDRDIPPDKREAMAEEVADILIYLLLFAHRLGIDPVQAAQDKIEKNAQKYPADLVRGKSDKYTTY